MTAAALWRRIQTRSAIERAALVFLALITIVSWAAVPTLPGIDAYHHLLWGRDLLNGQAPNFEEFWAPTPHPLYLALTALLALTGEGADRLLVLFGLLSFVALISGVYVLGRELFGRPVAVAGALLAGASSSFQIYSLRAFVDVPFLGLVVWAAALEVRRARRGLAPMVLLAAAGLLRPEAWLLAGLYWLWCLPGTPVRSRLLLFVLVAVPPALWAAIDLAVTGDPLFSLVSTRDRAAALGRERGLDAVPLALAKSLPAVTGPVTAIAGIAGLVLALRHFGVRRMVVPIALLSTGIVGFVAIGLAGLSLIPRYLMVPAVALCLFAGYALLGFTRIPAPTPTQRAMRFAIGFVMIGVGVLGILASRPDRLRGEIEVMQRASSELSELLAEPQVRHGLRCGTLTVPTYRLVPDTRWLLLAEHPSATVRSRDVDPENGAVAIYVSGDARLERYLLGDLTAQTRMANRLPNATPTLVRGPFRVYVDCPRGI